MARKLATEKIYSYVYVPQKFQGMKWPGSERAGSERTRERIGPGPIGRFAPGSELAPERKGSVPGDDDVRPPEFSTYDVLNNAVCRLFILICIGYNVLHWI